MLLPNDLLHLNFHLAMLEEDSHMSASVVSTLHLSPDDWDLLKALLNFLKPFAAATDVFGGESYLTLSLKVPIL